MRPSAIPVLRSKDVNVANELAARTLTILYNKPPAWLKSAHRKLDEAVFAAYGWDASFTDDEILSRILALNLESRAAATDGPVEDAEPGE